MTRDNGLMKALQGFKLALRTFRTMTTRQAQCLRYSIGMDNCEPDTFNPLANSTNGRW